MAPEVDQLAAALLEIRERVRARHPQGTLEGDIALPDLMPLLQARDAAEAKAASIGTVNPRSPGLLNSIAQSAKRLISRALDWHVREQVEFNRAAVECVQATLDALNEANRVLVLYAGWNSDLRQQSSDLRQHFSDLRVHWDQWREEQNEREIALLRNVADLHAGFQHRAEQLEADYAAALDRATVEIQKKLWDDLHRVRAEFETLIHTELRALRQRIVLHETAAPSQAASTTASNMEAPRIDWLRFADRFRGPAEYVKRNQKMYAANFAGATDVLDIGCGRGEMLEALREAGIAARGIDLSAEQVALCRLRDLPAEQADLFAYLADLPDASLGGIVCSQVVEHLPPECLPRLVHLAHAKLKPGAVLAIETPNPECLAIFATHFYIDPTHTRPVPPVLLSFYLEESGFVGIEVHRLSPAIETMPSLNALPIEFRDAFFGGLDYAIFGRKIGS